MFYRDDTNTGWTVSSFHRLAHHLQYLYAVAHITADMQICRLLLEYNISFGYIQLLDFVAFYIIRIYFILFLRKCKEMYCISNTFVVIYAYALCSFDYYIA